MSIIDTLAKFYDNTKAMRDQQFREGNFEANYAAGHTPHDVLTIADEWCLYCGKPLVMDGECEDLCWSRKRE
jgi:hypothetical protein